MTELTQLERERYKRHMMIEGFGEEGQLKLKRSCALVTRCGGLGGPVALYLAAAGIGKLSLLHEGNLTWSNLNRQILQSYDWVGKPRIVKIKESIHRLNPDVEILALGERISPETVDELVERSDIICDCPPTFEERLLLNEAIVRHRKPMVEAAMNSMEGYLTVIVPGETPCLRCLYPSEPPWDSLGFPVLGAVAATLGCLAAVEAIKVLVGFGEPLKGKMLAINMLNQEYRKFNVRRRKGCPVCGSLE